MHIQIYVCVCVCTYIYHRAEHPFHLHEHGLANGTLQPSTRGDGYRGASLIRKHHPVGPYSRTMPKSLVGSWGGRHFLMGELPL
jgi:hypothetical protein